MADVSWALSVLRGEAPPVEGSDPLDRAERETNRLWAAINAIADSTSAEGLDEARRLIDDDRPSIRGEALAALIAHGDASALDRGASILRWGNEDPLVLMRLLEVIRVRAPKLWEENTASVTALKSHFSPAVRRAASARD